MSEEKNSVVVSLLNVCSNIEKEVKECATNKTHLMGSKTCRLQSMDNADGKSDAYVFSGLELPEILKDNMIAWLMFVWLKGDKEKKTEDKYFLSLNTASKKTNELYSTFECESTKEVWDNVVKVSETYEDVKKV